MHIQIPAAYQAVGQLSPERSSTDLSVRHEGNYVVIRIDGPLALNWVAEELSREARDILAHGEKNLVLDMEAVPYIDSAGVGAMAATLNLAREAKGKLVLLSVQPRVLSVLARLRLDRFFTFSSDRTLAFTRS